MIDLYPNHMHGRDGAEIDAQNEFHRRMRMVALRWNQWLSNWHNLPVLTVKGTWLKKVADEKPDHAFEGFAMWVRMPDAKDIQRGWTHSIYGECSQSWSLERYGGEGFLNRKADLFLARTSGQIVTELCTEPVHLRTDFTVEYVQDCKRLMEGYKSTLRELEFAISPFLKV